MNNNTVWLEVDKTNQAILSYFLEQPTTPSSKVDYVQATQDELTHLSALEDFVFAPGTVATLEDLLDHRARVQTAKKAKASNPANPAATAPQQPSKAANKPSNTNPQATSNKAREAFISQLKQYRSNKRR